MSRVWVVNDCFTTILGTRTLWHDLCEWLDAEWHGDVGYERLAEQVARAASVLGPPDVLIRNATWFPPIGIATRTVAILQDIMPEGSLQRAMQVEVCKGAALTVFNSAYTRSRYPELANLPHRVIPLSVDFDLFRPMPIAPVADICWIGAPTWVKGWDTFAEVVHALPHSFALVTKEPVAGRMPSNVRVFDRLPHSELVKVINGCRVGLCTSREETQHLAGLEMGACGLPLVAPQVGAYYGRHDIPGVLCDGTAKQYVAALDYVLRPGYDRQVVRAYWQRAGFTREACASAWREAVEWVTLN